MFVFATLEEKSFPFPKLLAPPQIFFFISMDILSNPKSFSPDPHPFFNPPQLPKGPIGRRAPALPPLALFLPLGHPPRRWKLPLTPPLTHAFLFRFPHFLGTPPTDEAPLAQPLCLSPPCTRLPWGSGFSRGVYQLLFLDLLFSRSLCFHWTVRSTFWFSVLRNPPTGRLCSFFAGSLTSLRSPNPDHTRKIHPRSCYSFSSRAHCDMLRGVFSSILSPCLLYCFSPLASTLTPGISVSDTPRSPLEDPKHVGPTLRREDFRGGRLME